MSSAIAIVFLRTTRMLSTSCLGSYKFIALLSKTLTHGLVRHGRRLVLLPVGYQDWALALAGLRASALPSILAVIARFTEAGTNASMMRFSRPGTILDRSSRSALRPSDTHCSTFIGFNGMVP